MDIFDLKFLCLEGVEELFVVNLTEFWEKTKQIYFIYDKMCKIIDELCNLTQSMKHHNHRACRYCNISLNKNLEGLGSAGVYYYLSRHTSPIYTNIKLQCF